MGSRGYATPSWTDQSLRPTVITAFERPFVSVGRAMTGIGAGLLWLDANQYRPYPVLITTAVLPLPLERTSMIAIASTQPFQDFEWAFIVKIGVTLWFVR